MDVLLVNNTVEGVVKLPCEKRVLWHLRSHQLLRLARNVTHNMVCCENEKEHFCCKAAQIGFYFRRISTSSNLVVHK